MHAKLPVAGTPYVWDFFGSFLTKTSGSSATNSCLWENLAPEHSTMVRIFFLLVNFLGHPVNMEILKIIVKDGDLQLHQMQPASLRFLGHSLSDSWSPSPPLFSLQKTMIISIIIIFILILFPVTISRSIIIITTICLSPSLSSANNWTRPNMLQTPKTTADAEDQGILVVFYQVVHCLGFFPV